MIGKTILSTVLFFCLGQVFACSDCSMFDHGPHKEDTLCAVVMYGNHQLFDRREALSEEELNTIVDSLSGLPSTPPELIEEIQLYLRIRRMNYDEMVNLVDSLFDQDTIPYALINEVNLYMSYAQFEMNTDHLLTVPWEMDAEHPAGHVYADQWNTVTPNCYGRELWQEDTVLMLKLVDPYRDAGFSMPIEGVVTSRFGWRNGRNHNGIDIDLEVWDPVKTAFPGEVRYVGYAGGWGRLVVVRHHNGLETYYAHLHRYKCKVGDSVEAGDVIGLGGSSGRSSGSHLHFEVRFKGIPLDPSHLISWKENELVCDTLVLRKTRWAYATYPKGTHMHTVSSGEHLHGIAQRYGTTVNRLCELNGISRRKYLRVGQQLMVSNE